ncbi:hypothetical protein [Corallococcus sicarius]|nr:hypothetical protein [Corallococcus sicarius]
MDSALRILDAVSKNYPPGSKEESTVQLAAISLLYPLPEELGPPGSE